jgi:hypothetical protein
VVERGEEMFGLGLQTYRYLIEVSQMTAVRVEEGGKSKQGIGEQKAKPLLNVQKKIAASK